MREPFGMIVIPFSTPIWSVPEELLADGLVYVALNVVGVSFNIHSPPLAPAAASTLSAIMCHVVAGTVGPTLLITIDVLTMNTSYSVSYTHLTLPTNREV